MALSSKPQQKLLIVSNSESADLKRVLTYLKTNARWQTKHIRTLTNKVVSL